MAATGSRVLYDNTRFLDPSCSDGTFAIRAPGGRERGPGPGAAGGGGGRGNGRAPWGERWRPDRGKSPRRDEREAHRAQAPGEEEVRDLRGSKRSSPSGASRAAVSAEYARASGPSRGSRT